MKIVVGSKNPGKIQAVKEAFTKAFPREKIEVISVDIESGVSKQPMSDEESIKGARTRAIKVKKLYNPDFSVGLEGGIAKIEDKWFDCGWMVILAKDGREGIGSTIRMQLPEKIVKLIKEGKELGDANDIIFGTVNSKHNQGHFGLMTNNTITRISGYRDGVISALSRFLKPKIFEE